MATKIKSKSTSTKAKTTKVTSPAKTAVKTATSPASNPTTSVAATTPKPTLVSVSSPEVSDPDLKKKELLELVVARSGIKKKDAKPVVEAMLAVLGETIASGRELNLQPLGKLRINRMTDKGNGNVIVCKLRQSKPAADKSIGSVGATPDAK